MNNFVDKVEDLILQYAVPVTIKPVVIGSWWGILDRTNDKILASGIARHSVVKSFLRKEYIGIKVKILFQKSTDFQTPKNYIFSAEGIKGIEHV